MPLRFVHRDDGSAVYSDDEDSVDFAVMGPSGDCLDHVRRWMGPMRVALASMQLPNWRCVELLELLFDKLVALHEGFGEEELDDLAEIAYQDYRVWSEIRGMVRQSAETLGLEQSKILHGRCKVVKNCYTQRGENTFYAVEDRSSGIEEISADVKSLGYAVCLALESQGLLDIRELAPNDRAMLRPHVPEPPPAEVPSTPPPKSAPPSPPTRDYNGGFGTWQSSPRGRGSEDNPISVDSD